MVPLNPFPQSCRLLLTEMDQREVLPTQMLKFVKSDGFEGVVAKRADSVYQPGLRTGLWSKHRINLGQEFVIGGCIPSHLGLDSIVIGVYRQPLDRLASEHREIGAASEEGAEIANIGGDSAEGQNGQQECWKSESRFQ
jgi:hypothetical protein